MQAMSAIAQRKCRITVAGPRSFKDFNIHGECCSSVLLLPMYDTSGHGFAGNIRDASSARTMGLSEFRRRSERHGLLRAACSPCSTWHQLARARQDDLRHASFLALGILLDPRCCPLAGAPAHLRGDHRSSASATCCPKSSGSLPKWLLAIIVAAAGLIQGMAVGRAGVPRYLRRAEDEGQAAVSRHAFRVVGHPELPCMLRLPSRKGISRVTWCSPWASASPSPSWRTSWARSSRSASARRSSSSSPMFCCFWSACAAHHVLKGKISLQ